MIIFPHHARLQRMSRLKTTLLSGKPLSTSSTLAKGFSWDLGSSFSARGSKLCHSRNSKMLMNGSSFPLKRDIPDLLANRLKTWRTDPSHYLDRTDAAGWLDVKDNLRYHLLKSRKNLQCLNLLRGPLGPVVLGRGGHPCSHLMTHI